MNPDNPSAPFEESSQHICHRGKQHQNKQIMMICLEQDCAHRRKCCLTCIDQLHRKHEIISISKFQNYISQILSHNFMLKNRSDILKIIDQSYDTFSQKLEGLKQNFLKKFDKIKLNVDEYFKTIKNSFVEQHHQNKLKEFNQQFTDKKVDEIYKLTKETQKNLVQSITQIQTISKSVITLLDSKCDVALKQFEKNSQIIQKTVKSFKITGGSKMSKMQFNSETKAACLELSADNKIAKRGEGAGGYPIAVVNQPFSEINNQIKFRVIEQPDKKGIWLGVCVLNIVKNYDFKSCYGLNKGAWAIDQVGATHVSAYSWSHHDSNYNSAPKVGWQFSIGQIVTIKVDFEKSAVIFEKNEKTYTQPIQLNLGPIYAFAGPTNLGDAIEVI